MSAGQTTAVQALLHVQTVNIACEDHGAEVLTCPYLASCVHRFDHHCPWINNCVGENNRQAFLMYVLTQFLLLLQWEVLVIIYLASLDSVGGAIACAVYIVRC